MGKALRCRYLVRDIYTKKLRKCKHFCFNLNESVPLVCKRHNKLLFNDIHKLVERNCNISDLTFQKGSLVFTYK